MSRNIIKISNIGDLIGHKKNAHLKLKGNVVLMHKAVLGLDVTSIAGAIKDGVCELAGRHVTCQLISSTIADPSE
jgi:linoleate 9S-lipoxygenase